MYGSANTHVLPLTLANIKENTTICMISDINSCVFDRMNLSGEQIKLKELIQSSYSRKI